MNDDREYIINLEILGVAVKFGDIFVCLPKPNRHCDCFKYAVEVLGLSKPLDNAAINQGFYLETGKYLTRRMAFEHARDSGQLINPEANKYLFSEDVW